MPSTNLIKLAPTLSAEEKFKIVIAEMHQATAGEQPILKESELQAIIECHSKTTWEEFNRHMSMVMWASEFWSREIEMEKLRTYAAYLNLKSELSEYIAHADADMPEEFRRRECVTIAEWVEILERTARRFYAYLEAIAQFEQKLYGESLFDEKQKRTIDDYRNAVDDMFEHYNWLVRAYSHGDERSELAKKHMLPIAEDLDSYLVKKPVPEQAVVDKIIATIMGVVDAEMDMHDRYNR
jgi:hypothetical protein